MRNLPIQPPAGPVSAWRSLHGEDLKHYVQALVDLHNNGLIDRNEARRCLEELELIKPKQSEEPSE